jgi:hypothetical protein
MPEATQAAIDRNDFRLEAVPLAVMTLQMTPPFALEETPVGTRIIVEFTRVDWEGERLRAHLKGKAAADWLTVGSDGTSCLDFRWLLETHDGALIYVHGPGRSIAADFLKGGANYFSMSFETGDDRYRWLNTIQAIAKGHLQTDGKTIRFQVYELR